MNPKLLNTENNFNTNLSNVFEFFQFDKDKIKKQDKLFSTLELVNGSIKSLVGKDINLLNEFTVASAAQIFVTYFKKRKNNGSVFISHDDSLQGRIFANTFASILVSEKIPAYFNFKNKPLNDSLAVLVAQKSEHNFQYIVTFTNNLANKTHTISFFYKNGLLLDEKDSEEINSLFSETNLLNLTILNNDIPTIDDVPWVEDYKTKLKTSQDISNLSVGITNTFNFDKEMFEHLVNVNNLSCDFIEHKKMPNKANMITRKSIVSSFFKKKDLLINYINNVNNFEIIIKHKRRWKFINWSDFVLVYIQYKKLTSDKDSLKDKQIFYSFDTSKYIGYFGNKINAKTYEYESLKSSLSANQGKNSDKSLLLATNGWDYFITDQNESFCSDPILNLKIIFEVVSYFKKQNLDLYEVLLNIYEENGFYFFKTKKEIMSFEFVTTFFNKVQNLKTINNTRIIRIKQRKDIPLCFDILLEDKSVITLHYFRNRNLLLSCFSVWDDKDDDKQTDGETKKMNLTIKANEIIDEFKPLKENNEVKKFSWVTFIKYAVFVFIFIFLCYIMFEFILNPGNDRNLWVQIKSFLAAEKIFAYMIPAIVIGSIFGLGIQCLISKIVLSKLKQKVKFSHIFVSNFISICISIITPLIYGGESVGYWYLRRKGVDRAPVAAVFLIQSLIAQINIIIFSVIFVPLGLFNFYNIILQSNIGVLLITLVIIGVIIDIFGAVMISLLTFNTKITTTFAKWINLIIEWIPFIITKNASEYGAKLKYNFININKAAQKVFTDDVWYNNLLMIIKLFGLKIISHILDWSTICAIIGNMVNPSYAINGYFDFMSAQALARGINAINFIIPGGLGISDWAVKQIMPTLFKYPSIDGAPDYYNVSVWQTITRILFTFTFAIISAFALLTVFIGESRIDKYNKIRNSLTEQQIKDGNIKLKTSFYSITSLPWIAGIFGLISGWYLIYNFLIR